MPNRSFRFTVTCIVGSMLVLAGPSSVCAQGATGSEMVQVPEPSPVSQTIFDHPDDARWFLSGQVNVISQAHGSFPAAYTGENSLRPTPESATSYVATVYSGVQLARDTELVLHVETTGGRGLSNGVGIAGFPNYDVVRNPTLSQRPYIARLMLHQVIPLGSQRMSAPRGPMSLMTTLPVRRLEIHAGKLSTVDFFDTNGPGGDSRFQFMNWTVNNNGAYDFAADTRGYTFSALVEYVDRGWALRFSEALMPTTANGMDLDWNVRRSRGENVELELHSRIVQRRPGTLRLLAFRNYANMGSYRQAIDTFLAGSDPVPDITAHRQQGRLKYGFGANAEQEIGRNARVFTRIGWSDGATESFAFTEIDRSMLAGFDVSGSNWRRNSDKMGVALSVNSLSADHRRYLELGGHGFLLGDGRLRYGREQILEAYYTLPLTRGVYAAADVQYVANPGYNRDRGPVTIPSLRLHVGF